MCGRDKKLRSLFKVMNHSYRNIGKKGMKKIRLVAVAHSIFAESIEDIDMKLFINSTFHLVT